MNSLNGWQRLLVVLAILWAIPVMSVTITSWPLGTPQEILSMWANERLEVLRRYSGSSQPIADFRVSTFGAKTDEEIARPKGFDVATAVFEEDAKAEAQIAEIMKIDGRYEELFVSSETHTRKDLILQAVSYWTLPLAVLAGLGFAVGWVRAGFRRGT